MTLRRYARTPIINLGKQFGINYSISAIGENIKNGNINYEVVSLQEGERLDTISGKYYGDGRLFWVIAAASNIGNVLQVPAGTRILIPNLEDVARYTGG